MCETILIGLSELTTEFVSLENDTTHICGKITQMAMRWMTAIWIMYPQFTFTRSLELRFSFLFMLKINASNFCSNLSRILVDTLFITEMRADEVAISISWKMHKFLV